MKSWDGQRWNHYLAGPSKQRKLCTTPVCYFCFFLSLSSSTIDLIRRHLSPRTELIRFFFFFFSQLAIRGSFQLRDNGRHFPSLRTYATSYTAACVYCLSWRMTLSCRRYLRAMTKKKKVLPIFCFDCLKAEWLVTCERVRSTRVWFDRRQAKQMREAGVVYTRRSLLSPSSSSWVSDGRDGHLDVSGELETRETAGWLWTFSLHRSRLWSLLPFWWLSLSLLFLLATRSADGASGRTVNAFWYQNVRQAAGKRVGNSGQSISQGFPFCLSLADLHQKPFGVGKLAFYRGVASGILDLYFTAK